MEESIFDLTPKPSKKQIRKRSKKRRIIAIVLVFFALVGWFANWLSSHFSSVIVSICHAKVQSITMSAVNGAVIDVMSQSIKYSDIIKVEKDGNGDVALMETDSVLINRLARDTAIKSQQNLEKITDSVIEIPIGQLSGTAFLANKGPTISIKIIPYSAVNCNFVSEFESAGINQTRHKIFLNVTANVRLELPTSKQTVQTTAQVLVCESLLVGKVPEIYLNAGNFGGKLDLIP